MKCHLHILHLYRQHGKDVVDKAVNMIKENVGELSLFNEGRFDLLNPYLRAVHFSYRAVLAK